MDEIDAALDASNVNKISAYVSHRCRSDGLQCLVISLKDSFFTKADSLVGVYRDQVSQPEQCFLADSFC